MASAGCKGTSDIAALVDVAIDYLKSRNMRERKGYTQKKTPKSVGRSPAVDSSETIL
jgi:hypothetical protein